VARGYRAKPTKLYPAVLREIANLIEERRVEEVNLAALIEVVGYVRGKQPDKLGQGKVD
jgi:hypothetical protein